MRFSATKCNRAEIALSLLRENRNGYDIVLSDVHMPDMDGFKLLEHIGLEMDLPVISKQNITFLLDFCEVLIYEIDGNRWIALINLYIYSYSDVCGR